MRFLPCVLVLVMLAFYLATLAPGLLWGESAKFQRLASEGTLRLDETGHPLWVVLAHPLTRIPGPDPALACNLFSALLSALALWPAFRIMRRFGASDASAAIACLALAVSHTFWFHAVVAEVYALNSLLALILLDMITSALDPRKPRALGSGALFCWGLVVGLAAANHHLLLLWLPGYIWYALAGLRSGKLRMRSLAAAGAGFGSIMIPFIILRTTLVRGEAVSHLAVRLARQIFLPAEPGRDALLLAGYLLYQFPLPLLLAAAVTGTLRLRRENRVHFIGLALIGACNGLFAFSYAAKDRFAFYLPAYLSVALLAAAGLDGVLARMRASGLSTAGAILLAGTTCVALPPFLYALAPATVGGVVSGEALSGRLGSGKPRSGGGMAIRLIPGRDAVSYYLYPGKAGDRSARRFCQEIFSRLPSGAVLLADFAINEPMNYLQIVEGERPDLEILYAPLSRQLDLALMKSRSYREVFLAATDAYYNIEALSTRFDIQSSGPPYRLIPR